MRTRYSNMTDDEFLRAIAGKQSYSPIISELVARLSGVDGNGYHVEKGTNHECECPVCEGSLLVEYDGPNDRFELKGSEP